MPWLLPHTLLSTPPTDRAYKSAEALVASSGRPQYMYIYMDDLLYAAQGYPAHQQRVYELTIRTLK